MKQLKIILLFSLILRIILIITFNDVKTKYDSGNYNIAGVVQYIKLKDDKLDMIIKSKEKIKVVSYNYKDEIYNLGDTVKLNCNFKKPSKNTNFYLFNYENYLKSKKIYWICETKQIDKIKDNSNILYHIKNKIIYLIENNKAGDYLKLFLIGDNVIDEEIMESYRSNGISHLFAISGMHITLFTSLLLFLFRKNKLKKQIIFSFLFLYLFLANYAVSVVRSVLFFTLRHTLIKVDSRQILLFICLLLLTYNPFYIYNIGFLFSFIVSFSIIMFTSLKKIKNYFIKIFMISLISFITTTPIMINQFFQINLLSPIINIIFVPIISFIIFPFSLVTFIFPFFSDLYLFFIHLLENLSLFVSKYFSLKVVLSHMTNCELILSYIVISFVLYKLNKGKYRFLIAYIFLIFIHFLFQYINYNYEIHFINVGQGDSILIRFPSNQNILIDTGGKQNVNLTKNTLIPYLHANGISKLDYAIFTHGDYDHMGEAINLVNNFKVEKVIFNCGPYNDLENELIKVLDNKKIEFYSCIKELNINNNNNNKLYFLNTKEYNNENDNSNVIYMELNNYKFLFMGDASILTEKEILDKYNLSDIDVLKVGHHGSKTSSSEEFIDKTNPKYSLISVGKNNRYGHPNKEVLDNLEDSKIYRTDQDGSVMFKIKKNKLEIETCAP